MYRLCFKKKRVFRVTSEWLWAYRKKKNWFIFLRRRKVQSFSFRSRRSARLWMALCCCRGRTKWVQLLHSSRYWPTLSLIIPANIDTACVVSHLYTLPLPLLCRTERPEWKKKLKEVLKRRKGNDERRSDPDFTSLEWDCTQNGFKLFWNGAQTNL